MLDVDCITDYLLKRGLIDSSWIIDGSLTIKSAARRNRNLRIEGPGGRGFLVKQFFERNEGGYDLLACEAAFHRVYQNEPLLRPIEEIVPRLVDSDIAENVLIYELIADAPSLWSQLAACDDRWPIVRAARPLGHALATVHRALCSSDWDRDSRLSVLSRDLPWVLLLHKPGPALLASLSPAGSQTLRILQTENRLSDHLDALARQWRRESVIHGDVKLDNVLVHQRRDDSDADPAAVWITDWETVRIGDRAWDLAGVLQDFLVFWVLSMPASQEVTTEQMITGARVPLGTLRGAMRALWSGYRAGSGLRPAEADALLLRAVAYSGARLIQSAYELSHRMDRLAHESAVLLQIAANLLAEPEGAQVQLYGIPLGCPVA